MHFDPLLSVFFQWLGELASASFYIRYQHVRRWCWKICELAGDVLSRILAPWTLAYCATRSSATSLPKHPAQPLPGTGSGSAMGGFGRFIFGITMRYLGPLLGMVVVTAAR
jgi:L-rhamnose-H+ transport protein